MIRVSCPKCKAVLQVEDKHAGQVIACSTCKTSLRLPQAPSAPPPSSQAIAASNKPAPTIPKAIPTPPVLPAKQAAPAPAQPAPAPAQPVSAQPAPAVNPAAALLARLRQGPMAKWLTPKWIAIGCGSVASFILVVVVVIVITKGSGGPSGKGGGGVSGDKKSYTQRVLDLDPKVLKELKIKFPKDAKPHHPPGSVADFVQSVTLLNLGASCWDVKTVKDLKPYLYLGEFMVMWPQAIGGNASPIPRKVWVDVYGSPQNVKKQQEDRNTVYHWTHECTDETLNVRGGIGDVYIKVHYVHFSKRRDELCPTAYQGSKDIRYDFK